MAKYRTKPFEIEAVQFKGDADEVREVFPDAALRVNVRFGEYVDTLEIWDYLQQTWVKVNMFDYVIKGMKNEFYPCDPQVFEAKYAPVPKVVRTDGNITWYDDGSMEIKEVYNG